MVFLVLLAPLVLAVLLWVVQRTVAPDGPWRVVLYVLIGLALVGFTILLLAFVFLVVT